MRAAILGELFFWNGSRNLQLSGNISTCPPIPGEGIRIEGWSLDERKFAPPYHLTTAYGLRQGPVFPLCLAFTSCMEVFTHGNETYPLTKTYL